MHHRRHDRSPFKKIKIAGVIVVCVGGRRTPQACGCALESLLEFVGFQRGLLSAALPLGALSEAPVVFQDRPFLL